MSKGRKTTKRTISSERKYLQESIRTLALLISPAGTNIKGAYDPQGFRKNVNLFLRDFAHTIPCELGSIYMVDPVNKELKGIATFGYEKDISDITYSLGEQHLGGQDLKGQGITAFVATTGNPEWFDQKRMPKSHMAHAGKIDGRQWTGKRRF